MIKKLFTILVFSLFTSFIFSQGGVKGKITDERGIGIPLVDIYIKSLSKGTTSSNDGVFEISNIANGIYELSISSLGLTATTQSITIDNNVVDLGSIVLLAGSQIMEEVVVSGSRKLEKITESPVTIDVIGTRELDNFTGGNINELFAQQKGVDFGRIGAFIGAVNIRGFNSAFNPKMLQLDDNRYSTLIATGLAFGPMSPIVKEDIERVETVLGPSSALYGPNALNGLINTISKSPYKYEGLDIAIGGGSNSLFTSRLRYAKKIGDKWAVKVSGEYTRGKAINWTDSVYVPGAVVGEPDTPLVGKPEVDLDRDVEFIKGQISGYYRPTETSEIGVTYGASQSNFLSVTNTGRNTINDWRISFLQATYKSKHWFGQIYQTWSKTDNTFNNTTRTQNYWLLIAEGKTEEEALEGSLSGPGPITPVFKDDSNRFNAELQYNNQWGNLDFIAGGQYQRDNADSKGTYLLDADGPIVINQTGIYAQLKYAFGTSGFKLILAARGDDHTLFGFNFLPKAGFTYTAKEGGTWRLTYGKGFATPTILNTNMSLFGGLVLGNGVGFTLSDESHIAALVPETVQTIEGGYRGSFAEGKLFLDVNAYYNISDEFISPLTNIAPTGLSGGPVVTYRGDEPITDFTQGLAPGVFDPGAFILTYKNFGHVNTYGFDLGLNYYFSNHYNIAFNYSFFDFSLDEDDPANDGNGDGVVNNFDLPINTPKNKLNLAFNVTYEKFYASLFTRWVEKYDFFSGSAAAAKTDPDLIFNGSPVIEDSLVGTKWNYGPLGGFYMSVNGGYNISKTFSIGGYINNFVGAGNYEFITAPPSETMYGIELRISLF